MFFWVVWVRQTREHSQKTGWFGFESIRKDSGSQVAHLHGEVRAQEGDTELHFATFILVSGFELCNLGRWGRRPLMVAHVHVMCK